MNNYAVKKYNIYLKKWCIENDFEKKELAEHYATLVKAMKFLPLSTLSALKSQIKTKEGGQSLDKLLTKSYPACLAEILILSLKNDIHLDSFFAAFNLFKKEAKLQEAILITAGHVKPKQLTDLAKKLSLKTDSGVLVSHKIDPSILEGSILLLESYKIDFSLLSKLKKLEAHLTK